MSGISAGRVQRALASDPNLGDEEFARLAANLTPPGFNIDQHWDFVLGYCMEAPLKRFYEAVANLYAIVKGFPKSTP
jgi:hypothetical protein